MSRQLGPAETNIARTGQVALGLLWLADGALQFQPYMFGKTFVTGVILPASHGQPGIIGGPIVWIADLVEPRVALFNAGAATLQALIGLGLLYRPTVKLSLLVSFVWAGGIWFAGEGLGMIFTGTASPLTGAPGAALLYLLAGLICWPPGDAVGQTRRDAAARWCWSAVWLGSALLWLLPANDGAASIHDAIATAPAGTSWLSGILTSAAHAASGRGTTIALALATASACIGASLLYRWHPRFFLGLAIAVSASYWFAGQGFGGMLTGQATDPGSAPVMILSASMLLAREPCASSPRANDLPLRVRGAPL
ncbi:MAG: hypothetical protein ACRDNK_17870 [Solirubrobacteraceae bacterium]